MPSFQEFITAAEKGAASIYHAVLAIGVDVTSWEADHPALAPLIQLGTSYANSLLSRFGVSAGAITVAGEDVVAALKSLAATDATVPSAATAATTTSTTTTTAGTIEQIVGLAGSVVSVADPALAPVLAGIDAAAEELAKI